MKNSISDTEQNMKFNTKEFDEDYLINLYEKLLYPRLIEEKMLNLLRQGKISKWFSGIGQEAIAIAATEILKEDEFIFPMHRNLGVFTNRGIPLRRLVAQWQGKSDGFTKGRDRSFHFGAPEYGIIGMISHLGPQLSLADGVALSHKLSNENRLSIAFTGEGGTSEGEFHEALNVASVWALPVIFLVENNGYGLSTPLYEQFNCDNIADKGKGYGMESHILDGNNIIDLLSSLQEIAVDIRKNPRPVLVECKTFRMRGHEEASGIKYISDKLFEMWEKKDPVNSFGDFLDTENILSKEKQSTIKEEYKNEINKSVQEGFQSSDIEVDKEIELQDTFKTFDHSSHSTELNTERKEMRFIDAISYALDTAMKENDKLIIMGQDIAEYGGAFKITRGLLEKYGKERVRNTPLCESAIIGIGMGLSFKGYKSVIEMQFADFVSCGFNQIVNNLAKVNYRWNGSADVVIRMPTGGGVAAGPYHSQSTEAWFTHVPGLKVYYPSNPEDARAMLIAAIQDPNPVLFYEHKKLYRSVKGEVAQSAKYQNPEKAKIIQEGTELSIITYGAGVHWSIEETRQLNNSIEIIDIRSLSPIDYETITKSLKKTNRALILHEDNMTGGIGGEIAARLGEDSFKYLDAPIKRVASLDTPVPFNAELEKTYLASSRLKETIQEILNY